MNRIFETHGKFRYEGAISPQAMHEAILDAMVPHLPHSEERAVSLTVELDDFEIAISSASDDLPVGLEEAVGGIIEIGSPFARTQGAQLCYQVDLEAPSATIRATMSAKAAAEAPAARRRTCDLLARHGKRKEVLVYLRGLERAQSRTPGEDDDE